MHLVYRNGLEYVKSAVPATPNGLEMSRRAGEGKAAWAETSCTGSIGGR